MYAVTMSAAGGPEVLSWSEVDDPPPPGPGEVTIEVVASAVNRADLMQRMGHYEPPPGASDILGLECAGTIAAVGEGVEDFAVGDEVCALLAGGGYAQRVVVPAGQVLPRPKGLTLEQAAGLPEVACTVWSNVVAIARQRDGESFLVHGGASGIGTFAIQFVRASRPASLVLTTVGSDAKRARCLDLGAHVVISYKDEDFVARGLRETGGVGVQVILDNMGAAYLDRNVDVLALDGRLAIIGLQGGRRAELDIAKLLFKRGTVSATSLRARPPAQKAEIVAGVRKEVWPLVEAGAIKPVVDRELPMAQAADAHRVLEESGHVGKVLLVC
jgi:NADPH2:quinone reductase